MLTSSLSRMYWNWGNKWQSPRQLFLRRLASRITVLTSHSWAAAFVKLLPSKVRCLNSLRARSSGSRTTQKTLWFWYALKLGVRRPMPFCNMVDNVPFLPSPRNLSKLGRAGENKNSEIYAYLLKIRKEDKRRSLPWRHMPVRALARLSISEV